MPKTDLIHYRQKLPPRYSKRAIHYRVIKIQSLPLLNLHAVQIRYRRKNVRFRNNCTLLINLFFKFLAYLFYN